MKIEKLPQNRASLALENFDVYMKDLFWVFCHYLFISYFMESKNISVGKLACSPPWKKKKKNNEKTKRKEKRNREPPLRQQSKTDEADLFIRSHQNGRANVLNTAQDPLFCFGSTAIHPISGFKTFLLSYWAITRIWDFVPRLLGKNYPSQTARWTDIFKLGVAKPCTWVIQTN